MSDQTTEPTPDVVARLNALAARLDAEDRMGDAFLVREAAMTISGLRSLMENQRG